MRVHKNRNLKKSSRGFSTLEAIIAVALIATAFLPILILQTQLVQTSLSIERAEKTTIAMRSALALLRVTNPLLQPQGEALVGEAILSWTAEPISPLTNVRDGGGGQSRFVSQLFRVRATLQFRGVRQREFEVVLMGWRATTPANQLL